MIAPAAIKAGKPEINELCDMMSVMSSPSDVNKLGKSGQENVEMAGEDDSDANYSNEALQMIFQGVDAKISDVELLGKKKHLTVKGTPLALLNALQSKWREGGKSIKNSKCWESKDQAANKLMWHFEVAVDELNLRVEASDTSKNKAKQLASLKFLQRFFPKGYTWNKMCDVIFDKKSTSEFEAILEPKNKILLK